MRSRVRRRAQTCARCRIRKVHCDALPSGCSLCAGAGVPCVSLNPATSQAVPRSIAQFLETKIAEKEVVKGPKGASSLARPPVPRGFTGPVVGSLLDGITPGFLGLSSGAPLAQCVVAGTRLPSARNAPGMRSDIHEHHPKSIINTPPRSAPLSFIPVHVAEFLLDNYVTRVAPQYPIFYTPDLIAMHKAAFHQPDASMNPRGPATPYDVFTLNLVMAISLSTAARSKQARANAIAYGLFEKAMEQISQVLSNDLRGLQALILLTQYAFLNPGVANFWLLTGFISQACIDLGLHHELPDHPEISFLERDMRRRVFWCAWEMEIAVCGALLRPITLLRRTITTEFPSQLEDAAITATGVQINARITKFTSRYIWRYREVECDIVPVLFHNEPISPEFQSLEQWMSHQEHSILSWKAEIHNCCQRNTDALSQSQWDEMKLYSDIATDYILVTLFRPCTRIKEPSAQNLLKAFSAAVGVADGSWQQANLEFGNSKYVFHACYHSFSAAITFLQALQRIKPLIFATHTPEKVMADMDMFSKFFATVAERWPAASRCLDEYERLLAPIKKEVVDFLADGPSRLLGCSSSTEVVIEPANELEEALNFGTFFTLMPPGTSETMGGYYPNLTMAMDWEEEFNFDFLGQDRL